MNKDENLCYICYDKLENSDVIELKCGHKFHYDCIFLSYKTNLVPSFSTNRKRECPYCRNDGGYLPLKIGYMPQRDINLRYNEYQNDILNNNFEKWEKYFIKTNCYCILKTGKNSGKQCSRKKFGDTNYCKTHLKKFEPNKVENEETCLICPKVIN
jgi:hypothetical protein